MASIYRTATEYAANEITLLRGSTSDIVAVGVFHTTDAGYVPAVNEFDTVTLVADPEHPLADGGRIDIVSLIGPKEGSDLELVPGDYQRFVLIQTDDEDIIRRPDVLEIL
jgi:hypothetical protein